MAKHSKNKTSFGTMLFALVMAVAVVAGLISIITGKTANSPVENVKEPAAQEQSAKKDDEPKKTAQEPDAGEDNRDEENNEAPVLNENGEKISFGQIPQSTSNATPDEPDVTAAEVPQNGGSTGSEQVPEAPADKTGTPDTTDAPVMPEMPSASSGGAAVIDTVTDDWLILANKTHHLSKDYWPDDMVTVSSCIEGVGNSDTKKMRKIAADALEELIKGAAEAGYQIKMRTGFRSYDYQASLFSSYVQKNGEEAANRFSARAGESEHQTGLCCDVSSPSVSWAISYEYGKTAEGKWLAEHCHEYGFIVRYLEGKENITGYNYEPWHIRYVGVDAATEIFNKGMCFEEYLGITN